MKHVLFGITLCCLLQFTVTAQEVSGIQNYWKGTYLSTSNGSLNTSDESADLKNAQWEFIPDGNGHYRIKNIGDDTYLNIEDDDLKSTSIQSGWRSALWELEGTGSSLWTLENTGGSSYIRIRNVWKPKRYIHVENGLACSKIKIGWHSAMWNIEGLSAALNPNNNSSSTASDQEGINSIPNDYFDAKKALEAHNKLRSEVGVPPLVWDDRLARIAQKWANKLALKNRGEDYFLEHSKTRGLGENVAGGHVNGDRPETRIFKGWGENEKANFNTNTRKCYAGKICGHYTQIVWRNTTKVGCAVTVNENGKYILVCNYDPPGNMNNGAAF